MRAVVSDDGRRIVLTVYEGRDGRPIELAPLRAVDLARRLLEAALRPGRTIKLNSGD